jgi:PAS domain S-box-containing protein
MASEDGIYRQIVESSLDGLWVVDARGRTIIANHRVAELLGRSEAEIAELSVPDALVEEDRACFEAHLAELVDRGPDRRGVERTFLRPDGTPVPLVVSEQVLLDDEQRVVGYVHRLMDDGRRRALVDELSRSRSQLAEAQSIARLGSWEIHTDPREVTWSQELYVLLDVDPETFVAGPDEFIGQVVEADRQLVADTWEHIADEPGESTVDARVVQRDGSERWVRVVGQVLERSPDGTPLRFGGTGQDIHDLKETELKLLDAVELNTLMQFIATAANETNTLDDALVRTGELLLAHPDWERGVAFDVVAGGLVFRPVGLDDEICPSALEYAVGERALADGGIVFEEDADPQHPLIGFSVQLQGQAVAVLVVTNRSPFARHAMMRSLVDQVAGQLAQVAAREVAATELAAARDVAMAASQAKSEFLATMSHEIRTPLNGVIGLNDLLLRTDLDPHQHQLAEAMQGAGRSLLVLISDILDFSKIEAGGLELEAVAFRPDVLVRDTIELFAPVAHAKGIELGVELDADVPDRLEGDPSRFGQVLSNLVSNAVKFTHEGQVQVRVSSATDDGVIVLKVEVQDTGIGMDREQLGRIFQPFRQADASTTRNFGGTGLGLAIANRLASALGGEIGVDSRPGEGSTFWFTGQFTLPNAGHRPASSDVASNAAERTGGHVLVVEDNDVNQLVAVGMLEVLGYTSEVVGEGAAAAARAASGRFDAVLMDLQMPGVDGYAATRLIRRAEPRGVRVPIIALTASATSGEQEHCLAAGMTAFLSKPVGVEALGRVLREQVAGAPASGHPGPSRPAGVELSVSAPLLRGIARTPALDTGRLDELAEMGAAAAPLIQQAIDNFVDSATEHLDAIRDAADSGDAPQLRATAHRLKGSAANLGALRVAELAVVLEKLGEDERPEAAGVILDQLGAALDVVTDELADYQLVPGPTDEVCA